MPPLEPAPTPRVRIFCYHSVSADGRHPLAKFSVSPRALERQLSLLRRLKYRSLTLEELVQAFEAAEPVDRAVVLTFDDGYLDTYTTAAPIVASFGFRATVFVVTSLVGKMAMWAAGSGASVPLAGWEQIRVLRDRGWEAGLHTATHPDLTTLSADEVSREIVDAARTFERQLGAPARTVAYPYGRYSPAAIDAVRRSGARAAVTVSPCAIATPRSPRFAMPRYSMRRDVSALDFLLLATFGYRMQALRRLVLPRILARWRARFAGSR